MSVTVERAKKTGFQFSGVKISDNHQPSASPTNSASKFQNQRQTPNTTSSPKTAPISIIKPKTNERIQFDFHKAAKTSYNFEDALSFRTIVIDFLKQTTKNGKLSDEDFIQMSAFLNRYNFSRPTQNQANSAANQPDPDKQKITAELNKLTIDNFMDIIDNLTIKYKNFLGETYLKTLASSLVNQASDQPLYSSLYSLSAHSINQVLDNPQYARQRETFHSTLVNEAKAKVEEQIASSSKAELGASSFYGFLANREFVTIDSALDLVQKALDNPTASNIEITIQILIPAGEKIENKFPQQFQKIVAQLEAITKDKNYPGAVRYPLIDLLEARKNKWNTLHLMHKIVSTKESRNQNSNLTQVRAQSSDKPTIQIAAGANKFANLMDSDDDDDYIPEDEEELGYEKVNTMLRAFILENEKPEWKTSYPLSDLFLAISQRPKKEMSKAIQLLRIINEEDNLANTPEEKQEAYNGFVETVQNLEQDPSDPESAIENCGTIFGILAYFGIANVDQFGEVFPTETFRLDVVLAFLAQIIKVKKVHLIQESDFWMQYKWRPLQCSHLTIATRISELEESVADKIFELFPLYDSISLLSADVDDLLHPNEEEQPPNLQATIEEFEPSTIEDPAFAIAAIELLVKANSFFEIVLPLLSDNQLTVLLWVENYGKKELHDNQTIVKLIKQIATCGHYKLDTFLEYKGDEKHQEIVQLLKNQTK